MQSLADSNLWLAMTLSKHTFHVAARSWFESLPDGNKVLFCRATQQSYLRLLTTSEVLKPYGNQPISNQSAWEAYEGWIGSGRVAFMEEPAGLERAWQNFGVRSSASPKLWMDAYLAGFAVSAGCRLVTTDKGFKQFKGLDVKVLSD